MNLFFFQNCISPHQIPLIEELSVFTDVDRVVVIAPRVDYDDRKLMGWKASNLLKVSNVEFIIASSVDQVKKLYVKVRIPIASFQVLMLLQRLCLG